jgi:hypothetical protein
MRRREFIALLGTAASGLSVRAYRAAARTALGLNVPASLLGLAEEVIE